MQSHNKKHIHADKNRNTPTYHKYLNMGKIPLFGLGPEELEKICEESELPAYTSRQLIKWLYEKDISHIDEMTDLSKKSREILGQKYYLGLNPPEKVSISKDGTRKYLFRASDSKYIEAAWIPEANRGTLCLSTQIGCKMGCLFCMTGKQGFQGNLSAGEILNQLKSLPEKKQVSNIVFMGMGEPLDNLKEVLKSLNILSSPWGFAMSPRRITLSTIGILPAITTFLQESEAHLAISMHSPFDDERLKLMPLQKVHPLKDVIRELKKYNWYGQRRLSFEYIMFRGLNDSPAHINELVHILNGLNCRVNLIKFHPVPGNDLQGSSYKEMEFFRDKLNENNIIATIRRSRGEDIEAACGMLSTRNLLDKSKTD